MNHYDTDMLYAYASGETTPEVSDAIGNHVRQCTSCAAALQQCTAMKAVLKSAFATNPQSSERFVVDVIRKIRLEQLETPVSRTAGMRDLILDWFLPALQFACAIGLFAMSRVNQPQVDPGVSLLMESGDTVMQEDLSPYVSDLSRALGISIGEK